jgi:phosphonate metabolism protein PhnN/1,5-bisphosphokinase (PRPP-forming)
VKAPLILVVGPSGAGKDSLLACARDALAGDGSFHFARRVVTRPTVRGTEEYHSTTPEVFSADERAGKFLLSWRAHGLAYGIPCSLDGWRDNGIALVANVSRSVVDSARRNLAPVGIIVVTAPLDVLARRLTTRGRETSAEAALRLRRAGDSLPVGPDVHTVVNNTTLDAAAGLFIAALRRIAAS